MQLSLRPSSRSGALSLGLLIVMAVFVVRLFYLQVIKHDEYVVMANEVQISKLTINPERGSIYALDGDTPVPLVLNEAVFTVFADPVEVEDPEKIETTLRRVAGGNIIEGFEEGLRDKESRYSILARQVTRSQAEMIKKEDLAGIGLQESTRRVYPEGRLAAHVLGYVNSDGEGQYGLEGSLQNRLAGKAGMLQTVTDVRRIPLTIGNDDIRIPAQDGDDVVLTIDRNVQANAERLLQEGLKRAKATTGSVLVMNPQNGAVLAMANYPTYDPAKYSEVENYSVFQNRTVAIPYETGSVIKVHTMAAALDSGAVRYNDTFNNRGYVSVDGTIIRNVEEDPIDTTASMVDILRYSLNTGVVYALEQMGGGGSVNKESRETLYHYFHDKFRFGKMTGIEQAGEVAGTILGPDEGYGQNVRYANMTFGQGMDLTMIQTVASLAAIINGGTYYQPHLVAGTLGEDGELRREEPKVLAEGVISKQASKEAKKMIQQGRKQGFFGIYDREGYFIGGKTGTSQVIDPETGKYTDDNSIGTYLGFGATDTPSYVIMVKVDDSKLSVGYEGTTAAGPIFNELNEWMINYLRIQPQQ